MHAVFRGIEVSNSHFGNAAHRWELFMFLFLFIFLIIFAVEN